MSLVNSAKLVQHARTNGYAVAAVNTNGATYGIVRAVAEVAQEEQAPIILGDYEKNMAYCGLAYAGMVMRWFAERLDVPAAVHLDHGSSLASCREAIVAGFTSVMIDGCHLPIDENIALTREVVREARRAGVSVEAEIGQLQELMPDGSLGQARNLSDPAEATRISTECDIDMLAVGIGNAHGFYRGQPEIRFDLLKRLSEVSGVPLVLHGTTGLSDEVVARCVALGVAKVNLGTLIRTRYTEYAAAVLAEGRHQNHPWRVCREVKDRIKGHVRELVRVTGSAGRARELA